MSGFQEFIQLIADGEPVEAAVANRAVQALDGNLRYLRDLVRSTILHSYLAKREAPVEPIVEVGMPVYWNNDRDRFERAMLLVETDTETGEPRLAAVSLVWGIVLRKLSHNLADILLYGFANVDISAALPEPLQAGTYYLSPAPGRLIRRPASVPVPVLWADGQGGVFVQPRSLEGLEGHHHYRFPLVCLPAGRHIPPHGGPHSILDPDASLPGWLPADHELFDGRAPAGARFGYNMSLAPFRDLWPPLPVEQVALEWHRGGPGGVGVMVPMGSDGLAVVDEHGIWWMSNCYAEVPWPADLDTDSPGSAIPLPECPRPLEMQLYLHFTRNWAHTRDGAVLSLRAAPNSRVLVRRAGTSEPATTGHLEISDDLALVLDPSTQTSGHIAVKGLSDGRLTRGPVVEALRSGSSRVILTSNLGEPSDGNYQGRVTIRVRTDLEGGQLPIEIVRLEGVTEEFFAQVLGLGFPAGRVSSFRGRFAVPAFAELPPGAQARLVFRLLGRTAGTLPPLELSYRRIPRPAGAPLHLPMSDVSLPINTEAAVSANQYVEAVSSPFPIADGDVVLFSLQRDVDAYAGEVHVIHLAARID